MDLVTPRVILPWWRNPNRNERNTRESPEPNTLSWNVAPLMYLTASLTRPYILHAKHVVYAPDQSQTLTQAGLPDTRRSTSGTSGNLPKALGQRRIEFLINKLGMRSFTSETPKQLADEAKE
ncbi:hypothetical protein Tco_0232859 [Tanacetum coccineum]